MAKKLPRLTFECWSCKRTYTLMPSQITDKQELIVPCPYCEAEAVVKIDPFKKKIIPALKGGEDQAVGFDYDFPKLIPTQKPEEE